MKREENKKINTQGQEKARIGKKRRTTKGKKKD